MFVVACKCAVSGTLALHPRDNAGIMLVQLRRTCTPAQARKSVACA